MSPTFGLTIPEFGLAGLVAKDAYKLGKDLFTGRHGKNVPKGKLVDRIMKAPRGARGKQVIRKRAAFPKRQPVKRKSTKRKRASPLGRFKKPKKVRKIAVKYHNHRYEQEGTNNPGQPFMYVTINDMHKRDAIWDAMADALLRPILAKEFKFFPLQDTDKIGNMTTSGKRLLVLGFKRVSGIPGVDQSKDGFGSDTDLGAQRVDLDDTTYETQRTRVSTLLQLWADANTNGTTSPAGDRVAYFPYKYTMCSDVSTTASAAAATVMTSFDHLGETMIDLMFLQKTMFVNRTLAEGGSAAGQDLDRLGTNPLKGKLYQFNNATPRILDHVDMSTALRSGLQSDTDNGIKQYTSTASADSHLAHPLSSKYWLKNCISESNILLAPGQTKSHSTVQKIKGKISTLIERFYFAGYDKGSFGGCSMFMFDMVHKSDQTPATTYKRSCMVKSYGKLSSPKLFIPDFEATNLNL